VKKTGMDVLRSVIARHREGESAAE